MSWLSQLLANVEDNLLVLVFDHIQYSTTWLQMHSCSSVAVNKFTIRARFVDLVLSTCEALEEVLARDQAITAGELELNAK